MNIGTYRHLVTVEKPVGRTNEFNEVTNEWEPEIYWWCSITTRSQVERERAAAVDHVSTHILRGHYMPEITATDRITYGGRVFDIVGIINVNEMNEELELLVNENGS